jgi:hypothetical protein
LYEPRIVMTQERFQRILSELQFLRKRYALAGEGAEGINLFILKDQIDDLEGKLRIADVVSPRRA